MKQGGNPETTWPYEALLGLVENNHIGELINKVSQRLNIEKTRVTNVFLGRALLVVWEEQIDPKSISSI